MNNNDITLTHKNKIITDEKQLPNLILTLETYYTTRHSMNPSIKGLNLNSIMQQLK